MQLQGSVVVAHQLEHDAQVGAGPTLGHPILEQRQKIGFSLLRETRSQAKLKQVPD